MDRSIRLTLVAFLLVLFAGCSVQKRTLMPGYHVEWAGSQSHASKLEMPAKELVQLESKETTSLSVPRPAVDMMRPAPAMRNTPQLVRVRSISPKVLPVHSALAVLADPTPWAEAYEEQKLFGNIALAALVLSLLFAAVAAPPALIAVVNGAGLVSFFLNRRKRREVIDIKELNGYDVTEERAQFQRSNRLLGGAVAVSIVAYIVLLIVLVLAFIAFWESLFDW